ncbi:MAG TPA: hypothetical protein PKE16_06835 [Hyphomicrobium sp.]|nr:hypothetical protein [Hyphomicrobium sp.]
MSAGISVAALVSAGRHPVSGAPRACRGDAIAMALGAGLAGDALRVINAGDDQEPALKEYLAYGASKIEVLPMAPDQIVIPMLAKTLSSVDIILTGSKAEHGAGSGLLPYQLAEELGRPVIANAIEVQMQGGGATPEARVRQFLPRGQRRQIACPLPLVLVVHPLAPVTLKYAYSRRISGSIDRHPAGYVENAAGEPPSWAVEAQSRRPVRLKAADRKAGHARLLSAIMSEAKGGVVAFEGTSVDKAQVVLNYLREHRLIDF